MKAFITKAVKSGLYYKRLYDNARISVYSAQAAYFMLLSAVPLAMLGLVLAGGVMPPDASQAEKLLSQFFTQKVSVYLTGVLEQLTERSAIPPVSIAMAFLIWAATKGIRSIADGIHNIFDSGEAYNIIQLTVRSVLYTFVMFLIFALSVILIVFASPLKSLTANFSGKGAGLLLAVFNMRNIILFFSFTLLFALAYRTLAKNPLSFKNQLPGAAFASAGWILYSFGYSVYIKYFSKYPVLYGSFGAVMLFMLWLYMCMNILLCGALANRLIYDKKCD